MIGASNCPECGAETDVECSECVGHATRGTDEDPCSGCDNEGYVYPCADCDIVWTQAELCD